MRERIAALGGVAGDLLSIAGIIALVYGSTSILDRYFESMPEPDLKARVICERFAAGAYRFKSGLDADPKLMGVEIKAEKDASNIRVRLEGAYYIVQWWSASDGMKPEEVQAITKDLPTGLVSNSPIYIEVPRLMEHSSVLIQYSGITNTEFDCSSDWFHVSAPGMKTFHYIATEFHPVRELSAFTKDLDVWKPLFFATATVLIGMLLFNREKNRRNKKRA